MKTRKSSPAHCIESNWWFARNMPNVQWGKRKTERKESERERSHWHCVYTGHKYWFFHLNVDQVTWQFFCLWPFSLLDLESCHCKVKYSHTHWHHIVYIIIAFCFNEILSRDISFSHSVSINLSWASSFRLFFLTTWRPLLLLLLVLVLV